MKLDKPVKKSKPGEPGFEIVVPSCKICQLGRETRYGIDVMLATGTSQAAVRRHWNEVLEEEYGPGYINPNNISLHSRRHLNIRSAAIRAIIEKRAEAYNLAVDETTLSILTREAVLESVVQSGLSNVVQGFSLVEPREMLQAVSMLKQFEEELGGVAQDELWRQFDAFQDAVKAVVPETLWLEIAQKFEMNLGRSAPKAIAQSVVVQTERNDRSEDL